MQVATLVIAVVGLGLAALSLGWQLATFFLTGPRVKVDLHEGFKSASGELMTGAASIYTNEGRAALERLGYTEHVLAIEAINTGRLAATVNGWSIEFGNGALYENPSDMLNPKLPYRLEPHTSQLWCAPVENLRAVEWKDPNATTVRGVVRLAGRRRVRSRNALIVEEEEIRIAPEPGRIRRLASAVANFARRRRG